MEMTLEYYADLTWKKRAALLTWLPDNQMIRFQMKSLLTAETYTPDGFFSKYTIKIK
jgi:hypothetical protein